MEQRSAVLLIAGFATVLLAAALAFIPVPYAVFGPGPVINTLGEVKGRRLISVTGRQAYPTTGTLDMTTVRVFGGPGTRISLLSVLTAWISDKRAAVPEEAVFPPGQSQQQTQENDRLLMVSSQESATAAALGALGIPVPTKLTIFGVSPDVPAADVLKPQDVLVEVGDTRIQDLTQLRALLQKVEPGEEVRLTVRRGNAEQELVTRTTRGEDGQTLLGVFLDPKFTFPFTVKIDIPDVSGPSAGMVFALGIIDTLTPGDLTGGKRIAGTGTIDADGTVGPIGGIQQKLVGARQAGADYFLAPSVNCDEVRGHVPDGLHVVRVSTLTDARRAMEAIAGDRAGSLPGC
jgi:PDZ domain-containing protein